MTTSYMQRETTLRQQRLGLVKRFLYDNTQECSIHHIVNITSCNTNRCLVSHIYQRAFLELHGDPAASISVLIKIYARLVYRCNGVFSQDTPISIWTASPGAAVASLAQPLGWTVGGQKCSAYEGFSTPPPSPPPSPPPHLHYNLYKRLLCQRNQVHQANTGQGFRERGV